MHVYRTIAGVGAAALVFLALSRVSRRIRENTGWPACEYPGETSGQERVVIRRRAKNVYPAVDDVI